MAPSWLTQLLPAGAPTPRETVKRLRWPGDDREWVWNGEAWIPFRVAFDGGDLWERELDDLEDAA